MRSLIAALALCLMAGIDQAIARDLGQWDDADPAVSAWFATLMQPDRPSVSCCGESDAYWADTIVVEGDKVFAIITDDRPNEPLRRMPVPVGTKIEIPAHKLKFDKGNPTGHAVIFLSRNLDVLCFVQASGT